MVRSQSSSDEVAAAADEDEAGDGPAAAETGGGEEDEEGSAAAAAADDEAGPADEAERSAAKSADEVMGREPVSKQTDNMARQSSLRTLRGRFQSYVGAKDIKRDARRYLYCDTNRDGAGREEGGGA